VITPLTKYASKALLWGLVACSSLQSTGLLAQSVVPRHTLSCSSEFLCPAEIQRRVDFWVEVFSKWDKRQAVLHDANAPWRTFEVIKGVNSCSKSTVKKKRKRLQANLNALANNLKANRGPQGAIQQHLANQYEELNSKTVKSSANNLRCQQGVKDQFENALGRFHRYSPMTKRIVQEAGMPEELIYLPFVESSYRPDAYSKVGAAGMWQIMPNTARSLGMELNATLDERLDPEAATRAAMRYFKKSRKSLTSVAREYNPSITSAQLNPFMVTSYNYGVNGMRRAIKKIGPDFYKVLNNYKSANFQIAVKNFYASFLAARHLAINSVSYFPKITLLAPLRYQTLVLQNDVSLARVTHQFNLSEDQLKSLNPALTRFVWNNWRLIPAGYRLHLPYDNNLWKQEIAALRALKPEPQPINKAVYRVRKGDTACAIATAFKVKCKDLIDANGLGRKAIIRVGQRLDIPSRPTNATNQVATLIADPSGLYEVKPGDTACKIARGYRVSCKELIRLNNLGRKAKIFVNQKLRVPGVQTASSSSGGATAKATKYKVRSGDTLCQIAERFDISCSNLSRTNQLGSNGFIKIGQVLKLPGGGGLLASASTSKEQLQWATTLDDLGDIVIRVNATKATIRVLPNETIGHYADWIGVRDSGQIRRLNGLSKAAVLPLGKRIVLPSVTAQSKSRFEGKRSEYHQVLSEQFKTRFNLIGHKVVKVKSGQTLRSIASGNAVPLWLLLRFNPSIKQNLKIGQAMTVPLIQEK
jgi:membrane-bound lytic murein transglycosylase D